MRHLSLHLIFMMGINNTRYNDTIMSVLIDELKMSWVERDRERESDRERGGRNGSQIGCVWITYCTARRETQPWQCGWGKTLSATNWVKITGITWGWRRAGAANQRLVIQRRARCYNWRFPLFTVSLPSRDYYKSSTRTVGALAHLNATCCLFNMHSSSIITAPSAQIISRRGVQCCFRALNVCDLHVKTEGRAREVGFFTQTPLQKSILRT